MTANASVIFEFMKNHPGEEMTKQEIAAQTGLSVQAVTGTTNSLIKKGYAVESQETVEVTEGEKVKTKIVKRVKLTDAGLAYDPVAEEEARKAEKERVKAEKAMAKAAAKD